MYTGPQRPNPAFVSLQMGKYVPAEFSSVGVWMVGEGRGRMIPWADWAGRGGGVKVWNLDRIVTFVPGGPVLSWAAWLSGADFGPLPHYPG